MKVFDNKEIDEVKIPVASDNNGNITGNIIITSYADIVLFVLNNIPKQGGWTARAIKIETKLYDLFVKGGKEIKLEDEELDYLRERLPETWPIRLKAVPELVDYIASIK